ncbi:MAG TPA: hypothetical protein VHZ03_52870 [Trebonia sp.]|nr:hypothetical protein [Trebonia sp.]
MRPLGLSFLGTAPPSPVTPAVGPSPTAVFSSGARDREPDLAEVIGVLEEARILSPLSPVPATLAALSQVLGLAGQSPQVLGLGGQSPQVLGLGGTASGSSSGEKLPAR